MYVGVCMHIYTQSNYTNVCFGFFKGKIGNESTWKRKGSQDTNT